MTTQLRAPTPILVGVSGHRDIRAQDVAGLSRAIDEFFVQLSARYPHSDIVLLSGIASGADQLAAERAAASGASYIAVLPMPLEAYREDFAGAERERFEQSLKSAAAVVELPYLEGVTAATLRSDARARARQYEALGDYLVAHGAILLALWNGKVVDAAGGTSEVVARVARGRSRSGALDAFVYQISTPRISEPTTRMPPFETSGFSETDPALQSLAGVDRWNARAAGTIALDADLCNHTFAVADALAVRDQSRTHSAIERVYWYTLLSGLALASYDHLADFVPALYRAAIAFSLIFIAFIIAAIVTVRNLHANEIQSRFQDHRILAEGLRVQCALLEAELDVDAASRYLIENGDLQWIRRTIDVAYIATSIASGRIPSPATSEAPMVRDVPPWIAEQRTYYECASALNRARSDRANRAAVAWLRLSIVAGVLIALDGFERLIFGFGILHSVGALDDYVKPVLITLFGTAGSLAALTKGRSTLRGFSFLADRYTQMYALFADAERRLRESLAAPTPANERNAAQIVIELAREALAENLEWHSSERSRPLGSVWA